METTRIDKFIFDCMQLGARDLRIEADQAPVAIIAGREQAIDSEILEDADVESIVEFITPVDCQRELQETSQTEFVFGFSGMAQIHAYVARHDGHASVQLQLS